MLRDMPAEARSKLVAKNETIRSETTTLEYKANNAGYGQFIAN